MRKIHPTTDLDEESFFDPVFCPMDSLIEATQEHEQAGNAERAAFLLGIQHARIILSAATGGRFI